MGKFISSLQQGLSIISFGRIKTSPDASENSDNSNNQSAPSKTRATEEVTEAEHSPNFIQRSVAKIKGLFKKDAESAPDTNTSTSNDATPVMDIPTLSDEIKPPPITDFLASTMVVPNPSQPIEPEVIEEMEEMEEMADMADMSELFGTTAIAETNDISALFENTESNDISELFETEESNDISELFETANQTTAQTTNDERDISELLEAEEPTKPTPPPQAVDATIPSSPKKPKENRVNTEPEIDAESNENESFFKRLLGTITQIVHPNKKTEPADSEVNPESEEKISFIKQVIGKITQLTKTGAKTDIADSETEAESEAESDETVSPLKRLLGKKMIIIGLIIFIIIASATIAFFVLRSSNKPHDQKALTPKMSTVETLESRNKKLEEEYKKLKEKNAALLQENKKLQNQTDTASDDSTGTSSSSKTRNGSKSGNTMDCAITSKESAGKTLKDCIDAYNAGTR